MTRPADMRAIDDVVLRGRHVRLERLVAGHAAELLAASEGVAVDRHMPIPWSGLADVEAFTTRAESAFASGSGIGFVIRRLGTEEIAGATGIWNASRSDARLEIGATWIGLRHQRTAVNTETKRVLLAYAFETLGARRVEFKTDARNRTSRDALARIGAVEEGTLRKHVVLPDGHVRDTVYLSILADEWAAVRDRLDARLAAHEA